MICISLNKEINCEYICKLISKYIGENIKSKEQADKTILRISLVEIQEEVPKLEEKINENY